MTVWWYKLPQDSIFDTTIKMIRIHHWRRWIAWGKGWRNFYMPKISWFLYQLSGYICIYINCLFLFAQINTTKTQPGLEINFQTKLREFFSDFLGLTNFLRLEETIDWSKMLKFGRTCSNWQGTIRMNTKIEKSKIFKCFVRVVQWKNNNNNPNASNMRFPDFEQNVF